jgi:hypothetical protein
MSWQVVIGLSALISAATAYQAAKNNRKAQKTALAESKRQADEALAASLQAQSATQTSITNLFSTQNTLMENLTTAQDAASTKQQELINSYNSMVSVQQDQFELAQQNLTQQTKQYEEQKAEAVKREEALQKEIEQTRNRQVQEDQAFARARRLRGGRRGLLSSARLNPEIGLGDMGDTLGS